MIKIITLIGARPQIIKAAAISRAIRNKYSNKIEEIIVHSGQHYDSNMSQIFFEEMEIPKEKYNLGVGSASHALQTAKIMTAFEEIIEIEKPNLVLLYGDTNSTLAAALVCSKMEVPIVHVEGGVRSHDKSYPEEINRTLTDHVSSIIFAPSEDGLKCLGQEGFNLQNTKLATKNDPLVVFSGDIMYDNALFYANNTSSKIEDSLDLETETFSLLTMHRHSLSEDPKYLKDVFSALEELVTIFDTSVVYPIHPRVKSLLNKYNIEIKNKRKIKLIEPVSYTEMVQLEKKCNLVITDSGGVQKEAYFFKKPCLIMLEYTPWIELVENGNAILTGYNKNRLIEGYKKHMSLGSKLKYPPLYGDGKASEMICEAILKYF